MKNKQKFPHNVNKEFLIRKYFFKKNVSKNSLMIQKCPYALINDIALNLIKFVIEKIYQQKLKLPLADV